jgi:hypothetical protein
MEMIKYLDIPRFKSTYADNIEASERVFVTEKIDGTNGSFRWDHDAQKFHSFSRNQELTKDNSSRGFFQYVNSLNLPPDAIIASKNYRVYGEWTVRHKIAYREYQVFYVFDILDEDHQCWLYPEEVDECVAQLNTMNPGLYQVPTLYDGDWGGFKENMREYVGKSDLSFEKDKGEGWVLRRVDFRTISGSYDILPRDPHTFKMVRDDFAEVKERTIDPNREKELTLSSEILTLPRIEKQIFKLIDAGQIPEDWDETHMNVIARYVPKMTMEDCIKEEPDTVTAIGDKFAKYCGSIVMREVRKLLNSR